MKYTDERGIARPVPNEVEVKVDEEVIIPATKDVYQLKTISVGEKRYTLFAKNGVGHGYYEANGPRAIHVLLSLMFFRKDQWSEKKNIVEARWWVVDSCAKNPRHMPAGCYVDTGFGFYGQFLIPSLCSLDLGYKRTSVKLEDLTEENIRIWKEKLVVECNESAE